MHLECQDVPLWPRHIRVDRLIFGIPQLHRARRQRAHLCAERRQGSCVALLAQPSAGTAQQVPGPWPPPAPPAPPAAPHMVVVHLIEDERVRQDVGPGGIHGCTRRSVDADVGCAKLDCTHRRRRKGVCGRRRRRDAPLVFRHPAAHSQHSTALRGLISTHVGQSRGHRSLGSHTRHPAHA